MVMVEKEEFIVYTLISRRVNEYFYFAYFIIFSSL